MLFPSFANNLRTFSSCYKKDDKFYKCLSVSFLCISHHLLLPSFSLLLLCCFETTSIESPDENSGLVSGCQLCPQAWRPKTWTNEGHYSLSCLISWQHKNMKKSLNSSLCMTLFSEKSCCDQDTIFTSPSMFCWSQLKVSYQFPSFFLPHETEPLHWFSQWFKTLLQDREKRQLDSYGLVYNNNKFSAKQRQRDRLRHEHKKERKMQSRVCASQIRIDGEERQRRGWIIFSRV